MTAAAGTLIRALFTDGDVGGLFFRGAHATRVL